MQAPTVSLIVPTFNRSGYLRAAIASLVAQSRRVDELLIVDDGSTDDTASVVGTLPGNPVYLRKENGGRAAAINHGVRHAKGDLIWIFDDDDVALPNALDLLIAPFLDPLRHVDFTYAPWYLCNELPDGSLEVAGTSRSPPLTGSAFFYEMLFRCFTQGNAMLIAKRCYDSIGPMREDLIRSQDHEYMLRLSRRFAATPIPEPVFYWRRHQGPRGAGGGKMFGVERLNSNWHLYRQKIFIDVHRDFPLIDYLPERRRPAFAGNEREARLTRAVVMASHGLWHLALPELLSIVVAANPAPWSADELDVLARAATYVTSDALADLALVPEAALIERIDATPLGRCFVQELLRAGRWQVHNHWSDGERADAIRVARTVLRSVGVFRSAVRATEHLFNRRPSS